MDYTFTPVERIANILYVLDQLQDRIHDVSSDAERAMWERSIEMHLVLLEGAVKDMKPALEGK